VWGELSPPTSLTAAVSARIAEASFMRTMWEALKICLPVTLMTFAIFTRSDIVVNPGWSQILDTTLILISTCGTAFAMFGRFSENTLLDIVLRVALAVIALVTMFHPNETVSWMVAIPVAAVILIGIWRHRIVAPPKGGVVLSDEVVKSSGTAEVLAEARRDFG